jgi:hypothetical protein
MFDHCIIFLIVMQRTQLRIGNSPIIYFYLVCLAEISIIGRCRIHAKNSMDILTGIQKHTILFQICTIVECISCNHSNYKPEEQRLTWKTIG